MNDTTQPYTKKEHYIPQFYLRGFKAISNSQTTKSTHIWQVDKERQTEPKCVNIADICCETYLYELYNQEGVIIQKNFLENNLSRLEKAASIFFHKIENMIANPRNQNIACLFTLEEKSYLLAWITLQLCRLPICLDLTEATYRKYVDSDFDAKNIARHYNLITTTNDIRDNIVYFNLLKHIEEKDFAFLIGYDFDNQIITNDIPVWLCCDNQKELREIVYPMTSHMVLILRDRSRCPIARKNSCFLLSDDNIKYYHFLAFAFSLKYVYASTKELLLQYRKEI